MPVLAPRRLRNPPPRQIPRHGSRRGLRTTVMSLPQIASSAEPSELSYPGISTPKPNGSRAPPDPDPALTPRTIPHQSEAFPAAHEIDQATCRQRSPTASPLQRVVPIGREILVVSSVGAINHLHAFGSPSSAEKKRRIEAGQHSQSIGRRGRPAPPFRSPDQSVISIHRTSELTSPHQFACIRPLARRALSAPTSIAEAMCSIDYRKRLGQFGCSSTGPGMLAGRPAHNDPQARSSSRRAPCSRQEIRHRIEIVDGRCRDGDRTFRAWPARASALIAFARINATSASA